MFHLTVFFIIKIFLFAGLNFAFSFAEIKTKMKADRTVFSQTSYQKKQKRKNRLSSRGRQQSLKGKNFKKSPIKSTQQTQNKKSLGETWKRGVAFDERQVRKKPKARGIILKFRHWPDKGERRHIITQVGKQGGFQKVKTISSMQMLAFSWSRLRSEGKARGVCEDISQIKNLEYCEPDFCFIQNKRTPFVRA